MLTRGSDPKPPPLHARLKGSVSTMGTWDPTDPGFCPVLPTLRLAPPVQGWFLLNIQASRTSRLHRAAFPGLMSPSPAPTGRPPSSPQNTPGSDVSPILFSRGQRWRPFWGV